MGNYAKYKRAVARMKRLVVGEKVQVQVADGKQWEGVVDSPPGETGVMVKVTKIKVNKENDLILGQVRVVGPKEIVS